MVQTVCSIKILTGEKKIIIEKPHALSRIFFFIHSITDIVSWHETRISFDDPLFRSYFTMNGSVNVFKAEGADIFQGNIWAYNVSDTDLWYTCTEILR